MKATRSTKHKSSNTGNSSGIHFKMSNGSKVTGYKVVKKKPYEDVKAGAKSGLKTGRLNAVDEVKIINVQKFIIANLNETKLKTLVDLLYKIAISESASEVARIRCAETLLAYGIGKPKETLQLAMPTPAITVQHNIIQTTREQIASDAKMKLNIADMSD